MAELTTWLTMVLISFLMALGNVLHKIGTSRFGTITLQRFLNPHFCLEYLFTPAIFAALAILFLGKLFTGSPLSVGGTMSVITMITVLGLIFTGLLEGIILGKTYDPVTYGAMAVALLCVVFIGRTV